MKKIFLLILITSIFLLVSKSAYSQFGKNKVQYQEYNWRYIESKNFDIYYYDGGRELAKYTAIHAEKALISIQRTLNFKLSKRIAIIVYNSHNEFQQNNVSSEYMPEGVGGFTELYKDRVVLPFDGDYSQYRHVIHHELTHAVLNDMFYGGTIQTALGSGSLNIQFPLWMNEGLAEYESLGGYNTQTDMFMRDMSLSENMKGLTNMQGYYSYRGGQTFYWYIVSKYGKEKIGDLLNRLRATGKLDIAFKQTFNMTYEDFSDKFERDMKAYYWPDIEKYKNPIDYAKRITNTQKDRTYMNRSPSVSPDGERIAYISAPEGIYGIYIKKIEDEKSEPENLVSSFRSQDFEELNVLTPGISWNPQGTKLAISAKAGGQDAIFIVDVKSGNYEKKTFGINSITSVNWSPDGKLLTFIGSQAGQSDIYLYSFQTDTISKLTNDIFSDFCPVWSINSKMVYFISDRGDNIDIKNLSKDFRIWNYDVNKSDIYSIDIETKEIKRITNNPEYSKTSIAITPDGNKMLFTSDINGISNVYLYDFQNQSVRPITNSLTGVIQLSLSPDASKLLFSTQINGGYDIFYLRYPLDTKIDSTVLPLTRFRNDYIEKKKFKESITSKSTKADSLSASKLPSYGNFEVEFSHQQIITQNPDAEKRIADNQKDVKGTSTIDTTFIERPYKISFTPDIILANPSYSTYYQFQGAIQMLFSDVLGNHQIYALANLYMSLDNSNMYVAYSYLPEKIDYTFALFQYSAQILRSDYIYYHFRNWGLSVQASLPFDLFNRMEWGINMHIVSRSYSMLYYSYDSTEIAPTPVPDQSKLVLLPEAKYVHDDVLYGAFAPVKGSRYYLSVKGSPKLSNSTLGFMNVEGDFRHYIPIFEGYFSLAMRGAAGASFGPDPQHFFAIGTDNWINSKFKNDFLPYDNAEDFAFMESVGPLRGFDVGDRSGTRYFLTNWEFRFPIFQAMVAGPLPILITNVMGSFFFDMGGFWSGDQFKATTIDANGATIRNDLMMSSGIGVRSYIFGLPFKFDIAWTNEIHTWSTPNYLFSLGYDW